MTHPAQLNTVRCMAAPCEQIKRESNHWFVVSLTLDEPESGGTGFTCIRYTSGMEIYEGEKPVCGSACAQKLFEKFLTTGEI